MGLAKQILQFCFCFIIFTSFAKADCKTYFSYSSTELEKLGSLSAACHMNKKDLEDLDAFIGNTTQNESSSSIKAVRLYTYLYIAQSEAISLSRQVKGTFCGHLAPLTFSVLSLFFPEIVRPAQYCEDPFSTELAKVVLSKVIERIDKEDLQTTPYHIPKEKQALYIVGLGFTKLLPWYANPVKDYFPPSPPTSEEFWQRQVQIIKKMQQPLTPKKKEAIHFWAGTNNPQNGDWRIIANQFLFSRKISLPEIITARSSLMMGIYDSTIVGFSAKYQFLRMRPQEFDPSIHYEIPVPKHPSYPANHALLAWTAATILSHYFPSEKDHWEALAEESGWSRVWAGIHYPIDLQAGKDMGIKIGQKVVDGRYN